MTADGWTRTVRNRLGLGRLLPLGGPRDGAWISEEAAAAALRRATGELRAVRLDALRIALADPRDTDEPVVPPPPSALPPGPLRVTVDFVASPAEPLPETAARVRTTLADAATRLLGLTVSEVDLRITSLLEEEPQPAPVPPPEPPRAGEPAAGEETRAVSAALSVPGVDRLTAVLGRAVHIEERHREGALPRRHARVEIAVRADHRAVEVAREVRAVVAEALPDHPTVAVLVTAIV
ncbi:nucleopolyhedrovirus P10 family protein [Streptomyces sp. NPDC094149]|uniref:nucleopolyhedrovirus P10 family protein n=1 Tax=Streptomyces sp. NPDC094149 TaxID=3155079 RepID=UPI003322BF4E